MTAILTERQQRILAMLAEGHPAHHIARREGMKSATLDVHILRLERMGLVEKKKPTELYRLLQDFGVFLAARSWSEADKPSVLSLRERIVNVIGGPS